MASTGVGHPHIDARSLEMAKTIVKRIDADPTLIERAHWYLADEEERYASLCQASREWKQILTRPWSEVRRILLDESDEGQRLRSSKPFASVVTKEERLAIIQQYPPLWPFVPYDPSQVPDKVMARVLDEAP